MSIYQAILIPWGSSMEQRKNCSADVGCREAALLAQSDAPADPSVHWPSLVLAVAVWDLTSFSRNSEN